MSTSFEPVAWMPIVRNSDFNSITVGMATTRYNTTTKSIKKYTCLAPEPTRCGYRNIHEDT